MPHSTPTPRERDVLALAAEGLSDEQIARQLGISINTLRIYWHRIYARLDLPPRRHQAISRYLQGGAR